MGKPGVNVRDRLLLFAGVVLTLALLLPNHYPPWAAFHADLLAGVAFAPLMLWALPQRGSLPGLVLGAGLLSVVPLIQIGTGQLSFAGDGWVAWLYVIGFALAALSGARYVLASPAGLAQIASLPAGLLIAALISVGIAVHQWLDLQLLGLFIVDMKPGDRPYANLAQPNQLATLLMLGLASAAFLYEGRRIRGGIALASAIVLAFGLAMTQSRTPLFAACLVLPAYLAMRKRAALRLKPFALVLIAGVFMLTTATWPMLNHALLLPEAASLSDRVGQNLRLTLWQSMAQAVMQSPWIGYGWNQVPLAQQATALDFPATHWFFDSSHNLFLDIALWSGLPVALAVATGLLIWFVRRIAGCRDSLTWCVLLAVTLVFCHAMVEYPLSYAYFLLPVGFLMGALSGTGPPDTARSWAPSLPRPVLGGIGMVALGMFVTVVSEYLPLEEQWRHIRFEQARIGAVQAEPVLNTMVLTQLSEHARFARIKPIEGMTQEQLEWMRRVSERYAWAASTFKYAHAMALNGRADAASIAIAKLCKIQSTKMCSKAVEEWRALAEKNPALQKVTLPDEAAL
jgi:O-antigen ligase